MQARVVEGRKLAIDSQKKRDKATYYASQGRRGEKTGDRFAKKAGQGKLKCKPELSTHKKQHKIRKKAPIKRNLLRFSQS